MKNKQTTGLKEIKDVQLEVAELLSKVVFRRLIQAAA